MDKLIKFIERKIEGCNELGGLDKEKWAFIQCLKEAKKINDVNNKSNSKV